jgi:ferredoxin--NADP+ reductase
MTGASGLNVAIIGAGPAGIFAAKELVRNQVSVCLFNRDIKPGGLAEYGIYPDKIRMKEGLRKQFAACLAFPEVTYFGNVMIGKNGNFTIDDIRGMGFDAILVTTGAQGTKWLGIPGEDLRGVYHAKDLVYHYNRLPPYSAKPYFIGKNVVIIGVGNVMMDIARYLIHEKQVDTVTAIARRGPVEVKFSHKEMEYVGKNFDLEAVKSEVERATPLMKQIGQDPERSMAFIMDALRDSVESSSKTNFRLKFLLSPRCILVDENDRVAGIEVEENTLILENGKSVAKGIGSRKLLKCDTVIFAIGDGVDPQFGLPVEKHEFVKNPNPRFPIDGISYESFDPSTNRPFEDIFLAGWARKASDGLVGIARKDGVNSVQAIMSYLATKTRKAEFNIQDVQQKTLSANPYCVTKQDITHLEEEESKIAIERGLEYFKFSTNAEMLSVIEQKRINQP